MKRFFSSDAASILSLGIVQGLLTALSIEPFNAPLAAWIMPWPLFYFAGRFRNSLPRLLMAGAACAMPRGAFAFYWIMHLLKNFAGFGPAESLLAFLPFAVFFNLQIPAFVLLFGLTLRKRYRRYFHPRWLTAGLLALGADYVIPRLFPYSWGNFIAGNLLMAQVTDLVGVYGLTPILFGISYFGYRIFTAFIRAFSKGGAAAAITSLRMMAGPYALKRLWPMPLLLLLCLAYGALRLRQVTALQESLPTVRVAIINPNAPPEDESRVNARIMHDLMFGTIPGLTEKAARAAGGRLDLAVLPESAVPFICAEDTPVSRRMKTYSPEAELMVQLMAYNWNIDVFMNEAGYGYVTGNKGVKELKMYNSSILYSRDGKRSGTYQKRRLLAFGEYMPGEDLLERLGLARAAREIIGASRFASGPASNLIPYAIRNREKPFREKELLSYEDVKGMNPRDFEKIFPSDRAFTPDGYFLPLICYESLLPDHVRSFFNNPEKRNPDFIVNITQDGWYGKTVETYQHFELARVRAVETRRALVRSVNNGAAGFVDLAGRYARPLSGPVMTAPETAGFQVWDVPINREMTTVYTRFGDAWMVILGVLMLLLVMRRIIAYR